MFLQCGYGNIGQKLFTEFNDLAKANNDSLAVYDPGKLSTEFVPNRIESIGDNKYSLAFICVPTPPKDDGSCDTSIVEELCNKIVADIIIIKSTVSVGTTDLIREKTGKNIVFSPEFTSTTIHGGEHNYLVLGGNKVDCLKVAEAYRKLKPANYEISIVDSKTAELSKYAANCFLALKVTFCTEIAKACQMSGIYYEDVRNILIKDKRIGESHTIVFPDKPYYDSHCFNKDVPAFNAQYDLPLMKSVESINKHDKESKN